MIIEIRLRRDDLDDDDFGIGYQVDDWVIQQAPDKVKFLMGHIDQTIEQLLKDHRVEWDKLITGEEVK